MAHIEYLRNRDCINKPVKFLSLTDQISAENQQQPRCTSLNVFMSDASANKHQKIRDVLEWLSLLEPRPTGARHKIRIIHESSTIVSALQASPRAKSYKWLCTQAELTSATNAVAAAIGTLDNKRCANIVMKASKFVDMLGHAEGS